MTVSLPISLATQKALSGFDNSKVILIAGGLDRGNEFDELVPEPQRGSKKMVILGAIGSACKEAAADQAEFLIWMRLMSGMHS